MARQVLPVVGAVVGFAIGGPTGAQIGFALGSIVGNAVDPQVIQGPKIGEAGLQTSAEGVFRPIVFGTGAVKGNVIERGNRQVITQRTQQGKGVGPVTEQERVYWTFAIRIAEGPISGVTRIWQDEKLVYDTRAASVIPDETADFADRFRLYLGDETQLPDPDIEAFRGIGNTPAYRGTAYIVFPNFDLTDRRESIPDFRFEVAQTIFSVPLPMLPNIPFPPQAGVSGGTPLNSVSEFNFTFIGFVGDPWISPAGAIEWQPLSLLRVAETEDIGAFSRMLLYDSNGATIFDSQWFGPPELELELQDALLIAGRPELAGNVIGHPTIEQELRLEEGVQITGGVVYRIRSASSGNNSSAHVDVFFPNPNSYAPGTIAFLDVFGVLREPDGDLYATEWGPDAISEDGGDFGLDDFVSTISRRVGQDFQDFDVSELDDRIDGIVLAGDYSAADAIRTMMPIYSFDGSEYDDGTGYKIHYPKRGKPVLLTFTVDSLIDAPEKSVREDALERPKALHLHYENPTIGYAPAKATIRRNSQDVLVVGERSLQIPVSFTDVDGPAQIADKLMRQTWVEVGGEEEFTVPDNYLGLVASDCVGVALRGQVRRMRITSQEVGPGFIRLKMLPDRQSAYTSNVTGVPVPEPTPPLPSIVGQTIFEFLDIPALNDNNDRLLWYEAVTGQTPAWYGAQTQRKVGAQVEFENSILFNQNTIMGFLLDAIPAASEHYTDTTNVVRVELYTDDVLDSLTDAQFLSEGGSFALETPTGWEIMQYRDSVDEGGNIFALSTLLRGRLNTGGSAHAESSRFVLLDGVKSTDAFTAWLNQTVTSRAISLGASADGVPQYTNTYTGKSQTEFPVAHLFLERAGDTISATTVPRHRFGTELNPVRSSNWVAYRWTATDGSNTLSTDTTGETTSFNVTGWASPVTVSVSQVNRFTGAGPSVSESIA